jgi:hypothetical protein
MRAFRQIGALRLAALIAGVVLLLLALDGAVAWWWLALPVPIFFLLAIVQERLNQTRRRFDRAVAFYERGLARLEDRWVGTGEAGERFLDGHHPYAEDLDLFGKGSLFELLNTTRTSAGEETLARWLCAPASIAEVRARQSAVEELRHKLDLREDLAIIGAEVRAALHPSALVAWSTEPPVLLSRQIPVIAAFLSLLAIVTLGLWIGGYGRTLFLLALLAEVAFALSWRHRVSQVISGVEEPKRELELLAQVLARLEREPSSAPRLVELRAALDTEGHPPSQQIAQLNRLIDLLDAQRNIFFAPVAALLLWPVQLALAIERWRKRSGPAVARWLASVGEIEALCALAGYADEHPADVFPELVEGAAYFEGAGLGHPLIAESRSVRNDVRLCAEMRVLIVSGSNMSGKSTLLRTVGTNAVLALAGAPVRARRLRLAPLAVGASIRVHDSLQEGSSRFYAEITRLRQIVDLTRKRLPLLFLLDEVLHGTNSHDRRLGAEAVVRGLVERGAVGLVTTHDLALAHIAEALAPRAANVHFEDHLEDGRITFDYRMRSGVVQKSNALALMRSVGLEV